MKHKYGNIKVIIDNIKFDSKKEGARYLDLKMLLKAGEITNLELQPKFEIIEGIRWNGKKLISKKYIADFKYIENGQEIVEDVKGMRTREYILKRQLFLLKYPQYIFRES